MKTSNNHKSNERFVFREAHNIDELGAIFRLRYRVYRKCNLKKFVPENEYQIDIDPYDLRSRHFGLFIGEHAETPIGCLRVSEDRTNPAGIDIARLRNRYPKLAASFEPEPRFAFPLMEYVPNVESLLDVHARAKSHHQQIGEPGRLVLTDRCRVLRLAKHMVECAFAIYFYHYHFKFGIWCCDVKNRAFYRRYGLSAVSGIPEADYLKIGETSVCLIGTSWTMPARTRERLRSMALYYAEKAAIPLNWENQSVCRMFKPILKSEKEGPARAEYRAIA